MLPVAGLVGKRVLIVEEDDLLFGALSAALQDAGCETFGALGTPEGAMFLMPSSAVDVALLDIDFRRVEATRLVRQLRGRGVPLVLVSADNRLQRYGRLLRKPFTEEELIAEILHAITAATEGDETGEPSSSEATDAAPSPRVNT